MKIDHLSLAHPVGIWFTMGKPYSFDVIQYLETKVPIIIVNNSIGIGNGIFLAAIGCDLKE